MKKETAWFPGAVLREVTGNPREEGTGGPHTESWESYGYLTLVFCIQIENPSHGNFLICVRLLFHELVQIIVSRMTVITGKQSWNPRGWLSGQALYAALAVIKDFFLSCTLAVQMWQLPLHQTIGSNSWDWKHQTYTMTNFQFLYSSREEGHFIFHISTHVLLPEWQQH